MLTNQVVGPTAGAYFVRVAQKVFSEYLSRLGASKVLTKDSTAVRYQAIAWFVEIFHLPTDGPNYCPRVAIGAIPETHVDPRRNEIDICHTVPGDNDLCQYNFKWKYTSEAECET